jgi:hypothetical protein
MNKKQIFLLGIIVFFSLGFYFFIFTGEEIIENNDGIITEKNEENYNQKTQFILENSEVKDKAGRGEIIEKKDDNLFLINLDLSKTFTNPPQENYQIEAIISEDAFIYQIEDNKPIEKNIDDIKVGDIVSISFKSDVKIIFEKEIFTVWRVNIYQKGFIPIEDE